MLQSFAHWLSAKNMKTAVLHTPQELRKIKGVGRPPQKANPKQNDHTRRMYERWAIAKAARGAF
jgi:hypothetical protein